MVALLHPRPSTRTRHGRGAAPVHGRGAAPVHGRGAAPVHGRGAAPVHGGGAAPALRLVVDNTAAPAEGPVRWGSLDRSALAGLVAVAALVLGGLLTVRLLQGSPTAAGLGADRAAATAPVVAGPGERIVVARAGDSLWSIARTISPDDDPRPIVAALIEANGGDSVQIGQQIVVPRQLLD